jgi:hypothetical protein
MRSKFLFSEANPLAGVNRLARTGMISSRWLHGAAAAITSQEAAMTRKLIRYKAKPDKAEDNQRLIEAVFAELKGKAPKDVGYMVLRLADNSFVHIVDNTKEPGPLFELEAFQRFQSGIRERCAEAPVVNEAVVVGSYRMLRD